jgi:hypothetical protein
MSVNAEHEGWPPPPWTQMGSSSWDRPELSLQKGEPIIRIVRKEVLTKSAGMSEVWFSDLSVSCWSSDSFQGPTISDGCMELGPCQAHGSDFMGLSLLLSAVISGTKIRFINGNLFIKRDVYHWLESWLFITFKIRYVCAGSETSFCVFALEGRAGPHTSCMPGPSSIGGSHLNNLQLIN